MATRRRRTTAPKQEAPAELTHEDMLEIAEEREEISQMLDVLAEEAFSNLGEQDFFEVTPPAEPIGIPPAVSSAPPTVPETVKLERQPRYLLRNNRSSRYRRG